MSSEIISDVSREMSRDANLALNMETYNLGVKIPVGKGSASVKTEGSVEINNDSGDIVRLLMYDFQPDSPQCTITPNGINVKGKIAFQAFGSIGAQDIGYNSKNPVKNGSVNTYMSDDDNSHIDTSDEGDDYEDHDNNDSDISNRTYDSENPTSVWCVNVELPYETTIKIDGISSLDDLVVCGAVVRITNTDVRVASSNKIDMTVNLVVTAKVFETSERKIVKDAALDSEVRVKCEPMQFIAHEGTFCDCANVEDKLFIPQSKPTIGQILFSRRRINNYSVKRNEGYFDVNGEIALSIVYQSEESVFGSDTEFGEGLQFAEFSVPFIFVVPAEGISKEDMSDGVESEELVCLPELSIDGMNLVLGEDDDGENREIDIELKICACIECSRSVKTQVVSDVYGIGMPMQLVFEQVSSNTTVGEHNGSIPCMKGVELQAQAEPRSVVMSVGRVKDCNLLLKDGKPIISGNAEAGIIYIVGDGEQYRSLRIDVPFQQEIDGCRIDDVTDYIYEANIENCRSIVTMGNVLETKFDVQYKVSEVQKNNMSIPVGVKVNEREARGKANEDDIVMYIVKNDESVWDIAKRFLVSNDDILNEEGVPVADEVIAGSRVFIV